MTEEPRDAGLSSRQSQISNAMVGLMREWTGRGPTKARTHILDDMVVVQLEDVLLQAETTLVGAAHSDAVLDMRRRFQAAMREPMVAAVEEIMGRKVRAFLSDQHLTPDIAVELFVLAPADETEAAGDQSDPRA